MKFIDELNKTKATLEENGHKVFLPIMTNFKEQGEHGKLKIEHNLIREHFNKIKESDAILVLNYDKNGIKNYVGGNSFLEMGKAYDIGIPIYLLNPIPDISYKDELIAMQPIILHGNLDKLEQ
jgi:nucleoside 2-deoxyribosyltransferase